jgi:hypothetical protein
MTFEQSMTFEPDELLPLPQPAAATSASVALTMAERRRILMLPLCSRVIFVQFRSRSTSLPPRPLELVQGRSEMDSLARREGQFGRGSTMADTCRPGLIRVLAPDRQPGAPRPAM